MQKKKQQKPKLITLKTNISAIEIVGHDYWKMWEFLKTDFMEKLRMND